MERNSPQDDKPPFSAGTGAIFSSLSSRNPSPLRYVFRGLFFPRSGRQGKDVLNDARYCTNALISSATTPAGRGETSTKIPPVAALTPASSFDHCFQY